MKKKKKTNNELFFYNLSYLNEEVNKNEFIKENDLIIGKTTPDYF